MKKDCEIIYVSHSLFHMIRSLYEELVLLSFCNLDSQERTAVDDQVAKDNA